MALQQHRETEADIQTNRERLRQTNNKVIGGKLENVCKNVTTTETVTTWSKIDLEIFQTHLNPSTRSQLSSVSIRFAIQPLQLFLLRNVKMMREN